MGSYRRIWTTIVVLARMRAMSGATLMLCLALIGGCGASSAPGSASTAIHVVDMQTDDDRVLRYLVSTPSLERSATTPLRINVILPTDYDHHPKRHYPVLYALPGTSHTADVWPDNRSEERRVGNECGSTCRSRWSPDH